MEEGSLRSEESWGERDRETEGYKGLFWENWGCTGGYVRQTEKAQGAIEGRLKKHRQLCG